MSEECIRKTELPRGSEQPVRGRQIIIATDTPGERCARSRLRGAARARARGPAPNLQPCFSNTCAAIGTTHPSPVAFAPGFAFRVGSSIEALEAKLHEPAPK